MHAIYIDIYIYIYICHVPRFVDNLRALRIIATTRAVLLDFNP